MEQIPLESTEARKGHWGLATCGRFGEEAQHWHPGCSDEEVPVALDIPGWQFSLAKSTVRASSSILR